MGRRGPAPAPTPLKLIRGTRASRINDSEPQPLTGLPITAPPWMSDLAREEWRRVEPHLIAMGTLTDADTTALAVYCEGVARFRRLAELVSRSPPLIEGRHGDMVKNPLYSQMRDAAAEVRVMAREFGLTPSARSGIRVEHTIRGDVSRLLTGSPG